MNAWFERNSSPVMRVCMIASCASVVFTLLGFSTLGGVLIYGALVVGAPFFVWNVVDFYRWRRVFRRQMDELERRQEIRYLEWLHDASPDD